MQTPALNAVYLQIFLHFPNTGDLVPQPCLFTSSKHLPRIPFTQAQQLKDMRLSCIISALESRSQHFPSWAPHSPFLYPITLARLYSDIVFCEVFPNIPDRSIFLSPLSFFVFCLWNSYNTQRTLSISCLRNSQKLCLFTPSVTISYI